MHRFPRRLTPMPGMMDFCNIAVDDQM